MKGVEMKLPGIEFEKNDDGKKVVIVEMSYGAAIMMAIALLISVANGAYWLLRDAIGLCYYVFSS